MAYLDAVGDRPVTMRCDHCGKLESSFSPDGYRKAWFLNQKSPLGWTRMVRRQVDQTLVRLDYCHLCRYVFA